MGNYKYTTSGFNLSEQQRQFYEENGYIIIRNLVDHSVLDNCRQRFIDICNGTSDSPVFTVMKDKSLAQKNRKGEFLINKIQDFVYDDVLFKYCGDANVIKYVEDIIGPDIVAVHTMLLNKPPDANPELSLHPLHQDLHYFPFRPEEKIVAAWTAMERVDEENGCLFAIPGSHKSGKLLKHGYPKDSKNKLYHGIYENHEFANVPKVNLIMDKGDTVFFHPILLHGSGPNRTKRFRKAISCHYASSGCYFIDVKGTTQHEIAEEIESVSKKRGAVLSFNDIWRLKSRLVKGNPGNFSPVSSSL